MRMHALFIIRPPSSRLTQSGFHPGMGKKGKRVVAPILPMLSLEALIMLLVAGLSAAAAPGGTGGGVIRLPTSDAAASADARADDEATASAMPGDYGERPWKCCDMQVCTMSVLPNCWCRDRLARCSKACKECREVRGSDPPRYVCKDAYRGEPAPRCTNPRMSMTT